MSLDFMAPDLEGVSETPKAKLLYSCKPCMRHARPVPSIPKPVKQGLEVAEWFKQKTPHPETSTARNPPLNT